MPLFKKKQKTLKKETSSKTEKSKTLKKSKVKKDKKSKKDKKELVLVNNNPVNYTINQNNKCTINLEKGHEILLNVKTLRYISSNKMNYKLTPSSDTRFRSNIFLISTKEPLEIKTNSYSKILKNIKEFTISKNINYYFSIISFLALLTNNNKFFKKDNLDLTNSQKYPDHTEYLKLNSNIDTKLLLLTPFINKITKKVLSSNESILIKNTNVLLIENCKITYNLKKEKPLLKTYEKNLAYHSDTSYHKRPFGNILSYYIFYFNISGPGTVYIIDELNDRYH